MKKCIIVGSSAAAIGCLSKLRQLDSTSEIICITKDELMPYNTCLLVEYLSGSKPESAIYTKDKNFFDSNRIKLLLGCEVTGLNFLLKKIFYTDRFGDIYELSYDKLLLTTGTSPIKPNVSGVDLPFVFTFHTLADAKKINENLGKSAIVIGAGLSGVECADALIQRGVAVTLVEKENRVLPTLVDEEGSLVIEKLMQEKGVRFYKNSILKEIGEDKTVRLSNGLREKFDIVVLATGSSVNAIPVNEFMQTEHADVFAAGDVCVTKHLVTGEPMRNTTWPDATIQGMHAAYSMAGISKPYSGLLTISSSNFFDITFVSCNAGSGLPIINRGDGFYHKFLTKNGVLVGFLMVGNVKRLGELRAAIVMKTKGGYL